MLVRVTHSFQFAGSLQAGLHPDLWLTTPDGRGKLLPGHRVVLAAVSDKAVFMTSNSWRFLRLMRVLCPVCSKYVDV